MQNADCLLLTFQSSSIPKPQTALMGKGVSMPLSINVGLSRKASRDYQSTGVSINVTAELDQTLLARPERSPSTVCKA